MYNFDVLIKELPGRETGVFEGTTVQYREALKMSHRMVKGRSSSNRNRRTCGKRAC
jgi:hypothetical protein